MRSRCTVAGVAVALLTLSAPAAFAAPYAGNLGTGTFKGKATFTDYVPDFDQVACAKSKNLPKLPKQNIAGLNLPQYGDQNASSVNCGVVVLVTGPKGSVKVQIVDVNTDGKKGDLNLDKAAFAKIGAINNGIEKISWAVAP
ncbi:hypothetical protein SAMN05421504_10897 [Amycolatopsis xylanica]|uniref:Rare lipoprotein A (RlpA)-like double-psi beta-barrel n=1 Tax=Amycolatopsis xylanica TaxID=589385 RepID=A0A1H3P9T1_9PSEU|nr:RlpA-like double-psi beta-barrel domain-containing protein [Amycolatopsis xylanica]SDY97876.1 hypothetical protein SAMN05421504_10897 [Amycolatopsis xylanica]